jgi:hypothetical protein
MPNSQTLATIILMDNWTFMTRILFILLMLTLSHVNCPAQSKDMKLERMRISHNGDSLIKQEYELIVKSKKVYFITPVASHLHIKGGKYRTRVRFDKTKREKIFHLVNQLTWPKLQVLDHKEIKSKYFSVETLSADNLIRNFRVPDALLPADFKELFDTLTGE